tara:strand:- start:190 stop:1332 length:1143 start_codon:yes stop_codon:yes gene_type:complete
MAQHDYLINNGSGAVVRSDINSVLDAVATNNSGTTEPAVTHSFQWWADTTSDLLKQRNEANNGWIVRGSLSSEIIPNFESTGIDDNATSTAITIDASENVGIGTSSPTLSSSWGTVLHVESAALGAELRLTDSASGVTGGDGLVLGQYSGNSYIRNQDNGGTFFWTGGAERLRISATGDFLVGTTSSSSNTAGIKLSPTGTAAFVRSGVQPLLVNRLTSDGDIALFQKDGTTVGGISVTGSSTAYNTSSDYRLKENVTPMIGATAALKLLKPCNFDWIAGGNTNGFLAHELAEVVPEAATGTRDAMRDEEHEVTPAVVDAEGVETTAAVMGTRSVPDYQGIDQSKLVPLITATIQELIAEKEDQAIIIQEMIARIEALEE